MADIGGGMVLMESGMMERNPLLHRPPVIYSYYDGNVELRLNITALCYQIKFINMIILKCRHRICYCANKLLTWPFMCHKNPFIIKILANSFLGVLLGCEFRPPADPKHLAIASCSVMRGFLFYILLFCICSIAKCKTYISTKDHVLTPRTP